MRWLTPDDNDMDSARYDMVAEHDAGGKYKLHSGDANEDVASLLLGVYSFCHPIQTLWSG